MMNFWKREVNRSIRTESRWSSPCNETTMEKGKCVTLNKTYLPSIFTAIHIIPFGFIAQKLITLENIVIDVPLWQAETLPPSGQLLLDPQGQAAARRGHGRMLRLAAVSERHGWIRYIRRIGGDMGGRASMGMVGLADEFVGCRGGCESHVDCCNSGGMEEKMTMYFRNSISRYVPMT